jgi:hypothetical protein
MRTKTMPHDLTIMTHATRQDAELIVQIFNGPLGLRCADGLDLLMSYAKPPTYEQFMKEHPHGSEGHRAINAVMTVNETIATFVKQGILDRGLVYDLLWVAGVWERCKNIALEQRRQTTPAMWENFEALAAGQT